MLGFLGTGVFVECLKQVRTSHVSDGGSAVGSTYRRVTPHLGLELSCSSVLKDPTRPQMPRGGEGRDGCLMSERVRGATLGFYQTCGKTQWSRQPVRLMVFLQCEGIIIYFDPLCSLFVSGLVVQESALHQQVFTVPTTGFSRFTLLPVIHYLATRVALYHFNIRNLLSYLACLH